jgi:hypothetical protein
MKRWNKEHRCLICGGQPNDDRGENQRCHGYLSSDGEYAHCSREEKSAGIDPHQKTGLYPHKLKGKCKCGETHVEDVEDAGNPKETTYDYRDRDGSLLFQVVRKPGKKFLQRRPDGNGGWIWKLGDAKRVLYRLPELISALAADPTVTVYIAEGEKDVDNLRARGLVATCNPGGAGKWHLVEDEAKRYLLDRHVVILPDLDDVGLRHGSDVAASLRGVAASVRPVFLEGFKDVSDWFADGHTAEELAQIPGTTPAESDTPPDPWKAMLAKALADVQSLLGATDDAECTPLFDLDAVDLLSKQFDGARWLVTGLVTVGGITTIGGLPKAAKKTWLGTEIAVAIATGTKVCGEFYARKGVVAYFYAEDMEQQIQNRIRALLSGANRELEPGKLHPCPRGKFLDITRDKDLARIVASCRRLGRIDALVLDPLRDIHSAAEDKSDEMSPVMKRLRLLAEILDCTVVIVHHSGKITKDNEARGGGQRLRGSGAVHGSTDSGIYITKCEGDGRNKFKNTIESEIKGARSAGVFKLDLEIEDDADGNAECATWTFARPETPFDLAEHQANVEKSIAEDRKVVEWVKGLAAQGIVLSKTSLKRRKDRPFPERKTLKLIEALCNGMQLSDHMGRIIPYAPESNGNT